MKKEKKEGALYEFISESEEILENLNRSLIDLDRFAKEGKIDHSLINDIFRGAHTLKGMSGMFGFEELSLFSHNLENTLDNLRMERIPFNDKILDLLFLSLDILGKFIRNEGKTNSEIESAVKDFFSRLEAASGKEKGEEKKEKEISSVASLDESILKVLTEYEEHRLNQNIQAGNKVYKATASFEILSFDTGLSELINILKEKGEVIATLPDSESLEEGKINFSVLFSSSKDLDGIKSLLKDMNAGVYELVESGKKGKKPEVAVKDEVTEKLDKVEKEEAVSLKSISETVRVDIKKLDELMSLLGEIVLAKSQILKSAENLKHHFGYSSEVVDLDKITKFLDKKLGELQESILSVRMVPLAQIFEKLSRTIRKVSRDAGKEVIFEVEGEETELDKFIIEELGDPLLHIIRNSIDHGIEEPDERIKAGKAGKGLILVKAYQHGNNVVIEISDDGKGIDSEKVREKAVNLGLIDASEKISNKELFEFLFLPGFTTKDKASQISGRGVGMDVVKNNISRLRGSIVINSVKDEGTTVTLTLPITLAIIKALIVNVEEKLFAIPLTSIIESLILTPSDIKRIEGKKVIDLRGITLPLINLGEVFKINWDYLNKEFFYVVVITFGDKTVGVVVEELQYQIDIVIKSVSSVFKEVKAVAGAAELDNQKTVLVIDPSGLIEESTKKKLLKEQAYV